MVYQITLHSYIMKLLLQYIYDMKHGYIKVNTLFRGSLSIIKINYTVYYIVILHIFNIYPL